LGSAWNWRPSPRPCRVCPSCSSQWGCWPSPCWGLGSRVFSVHSAPGKQQLPRGVFKSGALGEKLSEKRGNLRHLWTLILPGEWQRRESCAHEAKGCSAHLNCPQSSAAGAALEAKQFRTAGCPGGGGSCSCPAR